ncbi:hypothetical protein FQA39_LY05126 [Lamprigera yunnana]|nr:hypothetical protein FQA39_LY05126 [Lamprigera yunnana]
MLAVMEAQQIAGPSSGTNSVPPECSTTHAQEFLTSGRTGRRNALPDILSEHALVNSSDLPARLQSLSTKEPTESTSKDKEMAELWNFKAPDSLFDVQQKEINNDSCFKTIQSLPHNHLVSIVIPNTLRTPETICNLLQTDCEYYKVSDINLEEFLNPVFIDNFMKKGALTALSINTKIDCDNCVSVTSNGLLILSLRKESYETFGLDGVVSHFYCKTKERFSKYIQAMPQHSAVQSLQSLCLESVGTLVVTVAPYILARVQMCREPQKGVGCLKRNLQMLENLLVCNVPCYLYDAMAVQVLKAVKNLIDKTKKTYDHFAPMSMFLAEMNVVVSLTEVVLNQNLKQIDFSVWPKIMRYVLYKNLFKLSGLEILNLGSCTVTWRSSDNDKCALDGIADMKNLRSLCLCFDCSDNVIQMLAENCPQLQNLDVTSSRSVTDRSVASLLKCKQLRELQLHRTSITVTGFAQLLIGLPKLQDIGRCDEFGNVIKYILQHTNMGPLGLRKLQTRDLSNDSLRHLVAMCPKMEHVCLFHDEHISDFTILTTLEHLKELKLSSCAFYSDFIKQLLEVRGYGLTSLHLEHVEEIDLNAIVHISQCCPFLKNLVLYNCDFVDQRDSHPKLKVKPYQYLERVFWVVDCAVNDLEFLLSHSVNIKFIHLGSSTGITHLSIANILSVNPMRELEELRILYSSDMNIGTVELLLASCPKLKILSELESWQGISMDELNSFRQYIYVNNFALDIRPTLSY